MSWDDCSVMVGLFLFIYFTSFRPDLLDVLLLELHINRSKWQKITVGQMEDDGN